MKKVYKIYYTNWINLVGFLIGIILNGILMAILGLDPTAVHSIENWLIGILMTPVFLLTYGLLPLIGFCIVILILDTLFFISNSKDVKAKMVFEWIIIIPVFIMWAFAYKYWLWISLSISLLVTQLIRAKKIDKILSFEKVEKQTSHNIK